MQQATNRTRRRAGRSRAITRGLANRRIKQQPNECDAREQTTCTGRRAPDDVQDGNEQQRTRSSRSQRIPQRSTCSGRAVAGSTHTAAEHMQRASCSRQCAADGVQQSSRAHPKRKPTQCDARGQATRSRRRANHAAAEPRIPCSSRSHAYREADTPNGTKCTDASGPCVADNMRQPTRSGQRLQRTSCSQAAVQPTTYSSRQCKRQRAAANAHQVALSICRRRHAHERLVATGAAPHPPSWLPPAPAPFPTIANRMLSHARVCARVCARAHARRRTCARA